MAWKRIHEKEKRYAAISKEGSEERITLHKGRPVTRQEVSQIQTAQVP